MNTFYLGDQESRYLHLAEFLKEEGKEVSFFLEELPPKPLFYIFPFGIKENKILEILENAQKGSIALVGKKSPALTYFCEEKGILLYGALEDEIYLFRNARATAEGVLKHVIEHCPYTLDALTVLVYGYGNCGSQIARLLWLSGCEVFVTSRERGMKEAEKDGFNIYSAEKLGLAMFDVVVNTVPEPIFSESLLSTMREDAFFFQVATGLSGIKQETITALGAAFLPLPRLPGLYAPKSEAMALLDLIFRIENPPPLE